MNALELRRRTLGKGVYKKTVEGNPAIAQGSLARRYPGITMQGWTEQDSTEGKNLFDLNGVEYSKMLNVLNGTISDNDGYSVSPYIPVKPNTIYSRTYNSIRGNVLYDSEKQYISDAAGGSTIRTTENTAYLRFNLPNNVSYAEATIVNEGSTLLPYEPYTGGQPSPSPEYPQEIKNAGKYDEASRKYQYTIKISDSEESPTKSQTVLLTSDRPLTKWDRLEKRNGQWGWVYKSEEIESYTDESVPGEYFSTTGRLSTGAQVWYETTTETFVPLLESEQEAMNALYTFRPTTVLSNDCGCNMTLTYKTKKSLEVAT